MAALLNLVHVIAHPLVQVHEVVHSRGWLVLFLAEHAGVGRMNDRRLFHGVDRIEGVAEEIIPPINEVTSVGAVGDRERTEVGLGRSAERVVGADKDVGGLVILQQEGGPAKGVGSRGVKAVAVVGVHLHRQFQLLHVVDAFDAGGSSFGPGQRRQEHAGQNSNDRDDDQQFDEGESE